MTKFQALFVKYLRDKRNCTWRALAAHYYNRYDNSGALKPIDQRVIFDGCTYGGNQFDGIKLCEEASKILNIHIE